MNRSATVARTRSTALRAAAAGALFMLQAEAGPATVRATVRVSIDDGPLRPQSPVPVRARDGIAGGSHCARGRKERGRGADGLFHPNTRALYKAGRRSQQGKQTKPSKAVGGA
jgi:hypothetical protein